MYPRLTRLRRALALALLSLTGGLAVGVPVLDSREGVEQPRIEAQHDSSRCSYLHDHNLCVIFQQTPAETALASTPEPLSAPNLRAPSSRDNFFAVREHLSSQSARAPPVLL